MVLSPAQFEQMVDAVAKQSDEYMRTSGFVQENVIVVHPVRGIVASIMAADVPDGYLAPAGVLILPPPLQHRQDALREIFARIDAQAAIWVGEAWVFPDSDPQAPQAFMAGTGPSPSEHPGRVEVVMVAGFWPLRGVAVMREMRIVRNATGAYLRAWRKGPTETVDGTGFSFLTSWLEQTLPQPGPGQP